MYVYIRIEKELWTVGFFDPDKKFVSESDHCTPDAAAERVSYLNGRLQRESLYESDH